MTPHSPATAHHAPDTQKTAAARPAERPAETRPTEEGDTFFVENAGLVILAPFLLRYHEANGLLEEGRFRDAAAAERGVHLLNALLTDGQGSPSQDLALNKVLCGLDPSTVVVSETEPTEPELALANTLLKSAIQNWPKLGALSLDGFRGSCLWRRGKLTRGEERWTLSIEHRGYDVLFSSLPWSFAVIKPLWMPHPLYVDWV